jgi:hypothetical protein
MRPSAAIDPRSAELTRIAHTEEDLAKLRRHLNDVIEGAVFKGSHRSGQFLKHIVEQALAGRFDSLKERAIGVDVFGRLATYDTGDDAIVRVTASDVRKRLLQHYERTETAEFRILLPPGSYIPEITRMSEIQLSENRLSEKRELSIAAEAERSHKAVVLHPEPLAAHAEVHEPVVLPTTPLEEKPPAGVNRRFPWMALGLVLTGLNIVAAAGIGWIYSSRAENARPSTLPWTVFSRSSSPLQIITSDPNIAEIQELTGGQVSVSDYANHNYIPQPNTLTPELLHFCRDVLRGDKSAAVDAPIAAKIAKMLPLPAQKISVHTARNIQLADLKTDDNFVLLGSPRSNPWSDFFSDQLDFRIVFDKPSRQEIVRNVRPQRNESQAYVPTAPGWATGQSFAIMALVQNPDRAGQVLLLAGANGEGTEAAGELATDLPRLATALQKCGISPSGPQQHFELLLRLNMMAGFPNNVEVVACHVLSSESARPA